MIFKMYPSIVSSVGGEHEAGLQQAPGWLRQGAEVLGLQGLRRQVNGRGAQEKNVMLGLLPTGNCCYGKDPMLCEECEENRKEAV